MNQLASETSPYLLQHKDNPVHWYPWGDAAWKKARSEQKLVLVSIGYSACHWCHVMEHEVFEDAECAEWMNKNFICIKVDREERPDVDHYYMDAVHLMGGRGGWPLNVFTLPDGRPVYGGTYFPKVQWLNVLEKLAELCSRDYERMAGYAASMDRALSELNKTSVASDAGILDQQQLHRLLTAWSEQWDMEYGGARKAPKFPMPGNLQLLQCFISDSHVGDEHLKQIAQQYLVLTLDQMAMRGLYDQIGGGFYRYSVDAHWKVPHFEKMLYDNAQLISTYSIGYTQFKKKFYKEVVLETLNFLDREMRSEEGLYFSALDADSDGEEGKYYVWRSDDFNLLPADHRELMKEYYNIDGEALWEHGKNNLLRTQSDSEFAAMHGLSEAELQNILSDTKSILLAARNQQVRPGLDYKCITSWNAMMITAFVDAYQALEIESYMQFAEQTADTLWSAMFQQDELHRIRTAAKTTVVGFLEDYAHLTHAYITLYKATFNEDYLQRAHELASMALDKFYDPQNSFFRFGSEATPYSQKLELQDNVIPSSNAVMCGCLLDLAVYFRNDRWHEIALKMLTGISIQMDYAAGYSLWLTHLLRKQQPQCEVVVVGDVSVAKALSRKYRFTALVAASTTESELPILKNKFGTKSAIYVCRGNTCYAPVHSISQAEQLLQ